MEVTSTGKNADRLESAYEWQEGGEHPSHTYLWPTVKAMVPTGRRLRILDAGCGNGSITAQLAALGHEVSGIDASPRGIELARATYPGIPFEVRSIYDDLASLAPRGGWDLAVAVEVIEHLFSPRQFLENMRRHLQPSGMILLSTPYHGYVKNLALSLVNGWDRHHTVDWECGHIKFFSLKSLTKMLSAAGFELSSVKYAGRVPLLWKSMFCLATVRPRPRSLASAD